MHFRQHVTQVLAVDALLASALHPPILGSGQGCLRQTGFHARIPRLPHHGEVGKEPCFRTGCIHFVCIEELPRVAPQVVDACLDLLMTFRCPVSESNDPLCSVLPVVLQFFYGFGGNARNLGVDQLTRRKAQRSSANALKKN